MISCTYSDVDLVSIPLIHFNEQGNWVFDSTLFDRLEYCKLEAQQHYQRHSHPAASISQFVTSNFSRRTGAFAASNKL
jgi:hypothetical protein